MSDKARQLYVCASLVCLLVVIVLVVTEAVQGYRHQERAKTLCAAHGMQYSGVTWNIINGAIVQCWLPLMEMPNGPRD